MYLFQKYYKITCQNVSVLVKHLFLWNFLPLNIEFSHSSFFFFFISLQGETAICETSSNWRTRKEENRKGHEKNEHQKLINKSIFLLNSSTKLPIFLKMEITNYALFDLTSTVCGGGGGGYGNHQSPVIKFDFWKRNFYFLIY